ncbi:MAG: hypothetical protein JXX28_09495 [Deltaproteobacteria bacterium]|nr:hypothetical protein [Deltaproteobacteria bacterium]
MTRSGLFVGLSLALTLGACGAARDLRLGDASAAQGDWVSAVDWYARAAERRPDDLALAASLEDARVQAVEQLLASARERFERGDVLGAGADLVQAHRIGPADGRVLATRVELGGIVASRLRDATAAGDLEGATQRLVELRRGFPSQEQADALEDALMRAWLDWAAAEAAAGRHAAARDRILALEQQFPMDGVISGQSARIQSAWVGSLRQSATRKEREGRFAEAYTEAALSSALSGTTVDAAHRDQLRRSFLEHRGLVIAPSLQGPPQRVGQLSAMVASALGQGGPATWRPGTREAEVGGLVRLDPLSCVEEVIALPGEHPYVSGTREVLNPDWAALDQRSDQLRHRYHALVEEEQALTDRRAAAEEALPRAQETEVSARDAVTDARRVLADVELERARAEDALDAAQQAKDALVAGTPPTAELRALAEQVPARRAVLEGLRAQVDAAAVALDRAEAAFQQAHAEVLALAEELRGATQELAQVRERRLQTRTELDGVVEEQRRTPRLLQQDLVSIYHFEVQEWTRTCSATLKVRLSGPGGDQEQVLSASAQTRDRTWLGNPQVGLAPDPLLFPVSDRLLQEEVDEGVAQALVAVVGDQIQQERSHLLARTAGERDQERLLSDLLLAWMMDPARAPETLLPLLRQRHGQFELSYL